jgi:hypothetical protein
MPSRLPDELAIVITGVAADGGRMGSKATLLGRKYT